VLRIVVDLFIWRIEGVRRHRYAELSCDERGAFIVWKQSRDSSSILVDIFFGGKRGVQGEIAIYVCSTRLCSMLAKRPFWREDVFILCDATIGMMTTSHERQQTRVSCQLTHALAYRPNVRLTTQMPNCAHLYKLVIFTETICLPFCLQVTRPWRNPSCPSLDPNHLHWEMT
jgi:hypothetical protein